MGGVDIDDEQWKHILEECDKDNNQEVPGVLGIVLDFHERVHRDDDEHVTRILIKYLTKPLH